MSHSRVVGLILLVILVWQATWADMITSTKADVPEVMNTEDADAGDTGVEFADVYPEDHGLGSKSDVEALLVSKEDGATAVPPVHAQAAVLMDATSGRVLFAHRPDEPLRIASITKVMTAILAIEFGDLDSMVTVGPNALKAEGSSLYLKLGEKMKLHDLLHGLMLRSGNDAAVAIAEHIGGSLEGFAHLMNDKAAWLGMVNSQFRNPHGLDDHGDEHFSSAYDMAILTAYALQHPAFQAIVQSKTARALNPNESWDYHWSNKNRMLQLYPGADGVKTGYTRLARRTLISSATRDGQQLIVVTLNDGNDWLDHQSLLDYGFQSFQQTTLVKAGHPWQMWISDHSIIVPLKSDELLQVVHQMIMTSPHSVAYQFGERGIITFYIGEERLGQAVLRHTVTQPVQTSLAWKWWQSWRYLIRSVARLG